MADIPDETEDAKDPTREPPKRAKSLWQIMSPASGADEDSGDELDTGDSQNNSNPPDAAEQPQQKPAGLWAIMGQPPPPPDTLDESSDSDLPPADEIDDRPASEEPAQATSATSLWSLMNENQIKTDSQTDAADKDVDSQTTIREQMANPFGIGKNSMAKWGAALHTSVLEGGVEDEVEEQEQDSGILFAPEWAAQPADQFRRLVESREPKIRGLTALALGAAAAALSLLDLWPNVWTRIPATIAGLAGVVLGLLTILQVRRARHMRMQSLFAACGVVFGVAGLFLGPLLLSPLGTQWRASSNRKHTAGNLQHIGTALNAYHDQHNQFPAGGVITIDENGDDVPMHSWMTALLPYLGENQLADSIELNRPYDDPANRNAMSTIVPAFLRSDNERRKTNRGLAMSHFAGVGGDVNSEFGLSHAGIFDRNSDVTRDQIIDGKSTTFIVGEISYGLPAWGQPDNWRTIGTGLNRDPNGFGNAAGTGALFLRADGSVKFYSNKTALWILHGLSTRDGNEPVADNLE